MDISFILSAEELFTLMSLESGTSDAGLHFIDEALGGTEICDLSGLVDKGLARTADDELVLEPVLRMIISALSKASGAERNSGGWRIRSPWVELHCEMYQYNNNHWKITPVNSLSKEAERL